MNGDQIRDSFIKFFETKGHQHMPSASLILIAWLLGGLQMLAGALTYAELSAAMPKAGGQYVYIREAYGSLPAFLFGWVLRRRFFEASG